jgi:hypothetical protein
MGSTASMVTIGLRLQKEGTLLRPTKLQVSEIGEDGQ